jgi:large subunit ribosomal protein L23
MKSVYDIIREPVITEASIKNMQDKKYTFKVPASANKVEIKNAVEEIFKVKLNLIVVRTLFLPDLIVG